MRAFHFMLLAILLALAACTSAPSALPPTVSTGAVVPMSVSSTSAQAPVIETLPSELSIPHFRRMTLVGTGLDLYDVLDDNAAYTRYAVRYLSNRLVITGIMNIPKGAGPFPLLVFNHGYIAPSVYTQGRGLKREQDYMARAGFAVLHTDYRGHAGSDPSPMTDDVYDGNLEYAMDSANAVAAVRAANLPAVDASRVGMLGHSLGGGVTLAVLTGRPDLVSAAVLYAPVNASVWENFTRWRSERDEGDRTLARFGTPETQPETWARLSPRTYLADIRAPVLLFQGSVDADVPKAWSDGLAADLAAADRDIEYVEYPGEGHEFGPRWSDFMARSAEFFRRELAVTPPAAVPDMP